MCGWAFAVLANVCERSEHVRIVFLLHDINVHRTCTLCEHWLNVDSWLLRSHSVCLYGGVSGTCFICVCLTELKWWAICFTINDKVIWNHETMNSNLRWFFLSHIFVWVVWIRYEIHKAFLKDLVNRTSYWVTGMFDKQSTILVLARWLYQWQIQAMWIYPFIDMEHVWYFSLLFHSYWLNITVKTCNSF